MRGMAGELMEHEGKMTATHSGMVRIYASQPVGYQRITTITPEARYLCLPLACHFCGGRVAFRLKAMSVFAFAENLLSESPIGVSNDSVRRRPRRRGKRHSAAGGGRIHMCCEP